MKKVKITKIKEREDAYHALNIDEGFEKEGLFIGEPVVGEAFWVGNSWRTSLVQEILTDNTFKTYNSIYKWELLDLVE